MSTTAKVVFSISVLLLIVATLMFIKAFYADHLYEEGVVALKYGQMDDANTYLERASGFGSKKARRYLVQIYAVGIFGEIDRDKAMLLLERVRERDRRETIAAIVLSLEEGHYVEANHSEAQFWRELLE